MKPEFDALAGSCPGVDKDLIREHLNRLEERYFDRFDSKQICEHLKALGRLSTEEPVQLLISTSGEKGIDCTVLAFDYPAEFSIISGVLSASGLNMLTGDVFTYERVEIPSGEVPVQARIKPRRFRIDARKNAGRRNAAPGRRRIIDHLSGTLVSTLPFEVWENRLRRELSVVIRLLEKGDRESWQRARQRVNELVAESLTTLHLKSSSILYPVHMEVDNEGPETRLKIVSQDTPFFLYALSTALVLRGISIESIRIRTIENRIEDEFSFLDAGGRKILEPELLNQVKLSVLLTKQFTYFLGNAPDPYAALFRFERLVEDVLKLPEQGRWFDLLSNPLVLLDLARLLGASDFLWEDFIRLQYETLLPMLAPHVKGRSFSRPTSSLEARLNKALEGAGSLEEQRRLLNEFKDREIFLFDLDHILTPKADFRLLAGRLTILAETVVNAAVRLTLDRLKKRFGAPKTVAGLDTGFAVLGLGKLGGGDLGYASDIELLFVYSDSGSTVGKESVTNAEFYARLVKESLRLIQAKQAGIFHIDLRLRPYGASGPLSLSLETFCRYYGGEGDAHSLERLALVRLRAIGGDLELGRRVERLRDEFVYSGKSISIEALRKARRKQINGQTGKGRLNAKLSPGALADLEYSVQLLQVAAGADHPGCRTPRIEEALERLREQGFLNPEEAGRINSAYRFLRRLINSLRMLRGSARDLFLPDPESDEYIHLARRMGYEHKELSPAQLLHLDFETHTAFIRAFVERHLGRESLAGPALGNVADLVLSDTVPAGLRRKILGRAGFKQVERAYVNLRSLARAGARDFAGLAVLAVDFLRRQPDPDMALNNWERFIGSTARPEEHYRLLLSQPRRLEVLLSIFSGSQFLSDTLIRNPEFFEWVTLPEHLHRIRKREEVESFFRTLSGETFSGPAENGSDHLRWLNELRRFRRREILRIGIRDICLEAPIRAIMQELSVLAEALIQVSLERIWKESGASPLAMDFCILALGKLGGEELNYSSDIDLMAVCGDGASKEASRKAEHAAVMEKLRADLSGHTEEGYAYRVDLRLRPYGRSGELVGSLAGLTGYYKKNASLWELQALLKARPVAGNLKLGEQFLNRIGELFSRPIDREEVVRSIEKMRRASLKNASNDSPQALDIKQGGIREVEFLVQALQLIHLREHPGLFGGNTYKVLEELKKAFLLPAEQVEALKRDYLFLRRVEHYLQIYEDRQTHTLPRAPAQLEALAKRLLEVDSDARSLLDQVKACLLRVRRACDLHLLGR